jgi:serine/threonine protein kinase
MKPEVIVETTVPTDETSIKGKVEKKGGKRIGYNYIILKSLKESPKNDVVKCIYIKSLTNFGVCVIKEGTAGGAKDKDDRDIRDRLIWQKKLHELLQDKVRIPRYIGSFEENGNYYLAIEHIGGKTLGSLCKKHGKELRQGLLGGNKLGMQFLDYVMQIINLLDALHGLQIVHRDASSANFMITPGGKVTVIDMELSYSVGQELPSPPFQLGTYGYMSPEQLAVKPPTIKEDVFSVGAILLQIWTGIPPVKLTEAPFQDLEDKVNFFIPAREVASIALQCLHPDPQERPLLKEVYAEIKNYSEKLKQGVNVTIQKDPLPDREYLKSTIQEVIKTLASPLLADRERGWFAENRNSTLKSDRKNINKGWYTSFNFGSTGVLYFLNKAHMVGFDVEITRPFIDKTLTLIEEKYINRIEEAQPGLHFGMDGVAACLAESIRYNLIDHSDKYVSWIDCLLSKRTGLLGVASGISGQGIANLISATIGSKKEIDIRLKEQVHHLLEKQDKSGAWIRERIHSGPENRITKGFAYGVAGIVYFLLEYAKYCNDKESILAAKGGLQWLMKNSISRNGFIEWNSFQGDKIAPWWCDGGPGIALAFIKAYEVLEDPLYKKFATQALNCHEKHLIASNLSQYNGLSGLGEIYLEAYQLLKDEEWRERAGWIAQIIMKQRKHHMRYGQYWLVENEKEPVPGFMLGNTGILHFLLRYCYNDKIGSPMMPSFGTYQTAEDAQMAYQLFSRK